MCYCFRSHETWRIFLSTTITHTKQIAIKTTWNAFFFFGELEKLVDLIDLTAITYTK